MALYMCIVTTAGIGQRSTKIKGGILTKPLAVQYDTNIYTVFSHRGAHSLAESEPYEAPKPLWKPSAARLVLVCSVNLCGSSTHQVEAFTYRSVVKAAFRNFRCKVSGV